jgi:hypothetical protein
MDVPQWSFSEVKFREIARSKLWLVNEPRKNSGIRPNESNSCVIARPIDPISRVFL